MSEIDIEMIRGMVEQVLAEKFTPQPILIDGFEVTPEPAQGKRRTYFRATITIDQKLWELLQDECKRLGILTPRFIDSLLWSYFNKPVLSYQEEELPITQSKEE